MTSSNYNFTIGSDNVFKDLGFSEKDANLLKQMADLMINLTSIIDKQDWSLKEASQFLGLTENQVNDLMSGEIDSFTLEELSRIKLFANEKILSKSYDKSQA